MSVTVESSVSLLNSNNLERDKTEFRVYEDTGIQDRVSRFYYENHLNQTYEFAVKKKEQFTQLNKLKMSVMDAVKLLNEIVDDSDPDTDYPQIIHLLQTAEAIRQKYPGEEYDWFHLTGFIHDLGKILSHPSAFNESQWCVVGDTFPVGCAYSEKIIYNDFFKLNPDYKHPVYSTKNGVYTEGCGLDNVTFSWGHDEYLYQVCVRNKSTLPPQALYMIRYHSCYAVHQGGAYSHLYNDHDREMIPWLKEFQTFDLYSKLPKKPDPDELLPYYQKLMDKYFPAVLNW